MKEGTLQIFKHPNFVHSHAQTINFSKKPPDFIAIFQSEIIGSCPVSKQSISKFEEFSEEQKILKDFEIIREHLIDGYSLKNSSVSSFFKTHGLHKSVNAFHQGIVVNDFGVVRDFLQRDTPTLIISKFLAPYNKQLGFDAIIVKYINVPKIISTLFPSNAKPVKLISKTLGFSSPRYVALFPENFSTHSKLTKNNPVYYFMDKFVNRFKMRTLPFLTSGRVNNSFFSDIIKVNDKRLLTVASVWVSMHEHFHTQGHLPIPESLFQKSSRSSAALEELRVDLLTILHSVDTLHGEFVSIGNLIAQFVLAERLFRYPIDANPQDDYDSRSSLLFAHMLKNENVLSWGKSKIEIHSEKLIPAIRSVVSKIEMLEESVKKLNILEQKAALEKFVLAHFPTDLAGRFQNIPVFEDFHEFV
jgi:Family of unknown function (DUF6421)